jgi:hypothetical protein
VRTNNFTITIEEPNIKNLRFEDINRTSILLRWDNSVAGNWTSLYIYNLNEQTVAFDLQAVLFVTNNNGTFTSLDPNTEYKLRWQQGVTGYEGEYGESYFRTSGWHPQLTNWPYRRLITIDSSQISVDTDTGVLNISLTDDNFQRTALWSTYPDFDTLNYTNGNDIRFTDYQSQNILPYDIKEWNIAGTGGSTTQTIPDSTMYVGSYDNTTFCHDADWGSRCIPSQVGLFGTQWYNYTIPAGAKTTSLLRLYVGTWYWDSEIPADCFGGDNLEFKTLQNYSIPYADTYCMNQTSNNWTLVYENNNASS